MPLSISTLRGWMLSVVALAAIALPTAPAAFAQDPPEIIIQPDDAVACNGYDATFTVVAIGDPPLEYQWYDNDGVAIPGANESSYTIESVGPDAAGQFHVVVSNPYGSDESEPATLTVLDSTPPNIIDQPQDADVCDGEGITLSVTADGSEPLSYQWREFDPINEEWVDIPGATSETYTIDPVSTEDTGDYDVVITNVCDEVISDPATLTVGTAPSITGQPASQQVCEDDPVTFSVVATGTPAPSYQWRKDGADISGETSETYTIDPVSTEDSGDYDVVVANACGEFPSDAATLTVDEPPQITVQPAPAIIAREQTNVFCVAVIGTAPFEYQWRQDGIDILDATQNCYETGEAGVYTCVVTNRCDEVGVVSDAAELTIASEVIVSATTSAPGIKLGDSATLTATAEDGLGPYTYLWSTGATTATTVATPTESTVYTVTATDSLGQTAEADVTVVVALPPIVQTRASAYILQPGESSTLTASVITGGLVPFSFAWSTGQTTASIVVTPLVDTTYYVTVTDALGQTGSASVTITVNYETGDDQSGADQPPADEPDDGTDTGDDQDDDTGDDTGDGQQDQPEPDTSAAAGLCPLVSFSMISLLIAGLCWARGVGPRRRR